MRVCWWIGAWVSSAAGPAFAASGAETGEEPPQPPPRSSHAVVRPDGVWEWVERMEAPATPEQAEAIREVREEEVAEAAVIEDELTALPPPAEFYADPEAAVTPDRLFLEQLDPREFDIPIDVNDSVRKWMEYFTGPRRDTFALWLARGGRYQPMMRRQLAEAGLPQDLVYLSMIESGYNTLARSHASAVGLWQFIPGTARDYDLRMDWWVDERQDPAHALGAAITYLSRLHREFGDWRLAWAGYNTGEGRVRSVVKAHGTRDFWELAEKDAWFSETENYVPKIMAAAIIAKHPERYGFTDIDPWKELAYDVVSVDGAVDLEVLAKCAGITVEDLRALNPALQRFATPPRGYDVHVPAGREQAFIAELASVPARERLSVPVHVVRRDETLSVIARRYKSSVDDIQSANGLASADLIEVGMALVIPGGVEKGRRIVLAEAIPTASSGRARASDAVAKIEEIRPGSVGVRASRPLPPKAEPAAPEPAEPAQITHQVREGEFLSKIAQQYGVSLAALKAVNGLKSDVIVPGKVLKIPASAGSAPSAPPSSSTPKTHTVARGETLSRIARAAGVDLAQLQEWNGIDDPSHIEVGQKLSVAGYAPGIWKEYAVVGGDNLTLIAKRYGCTVAEIVDWNRLKTEVIQPGQVLKIRPRGR